VIPGPTSNLYLLPSGAVPPNPAELLAGTRLVQLMEDAGKRFDLIFIDSPPVLTFADAPILSSVCDATIVVIQSSGVFRQTVRRSIERLLGANAKIAGAILTKFDPRKVGYGAAYNYGYGYGGGNRRATGAPAEARRIRHFSESGASRQDSLLD
jgi:capsular exopolysaccharide synthesis family protein